ncbi:nucleotide exchange factor GrpE [Candidatus Amesbacteria bacterium RIFCSPLOWO2_01_FULL_49_25]|uniref:Protein GrpE n=1 Tax=Candidatus Amesbacteria bacterium RIFCSPHIGHO2_01_FULL_48_32b TaxID=1797253 RepID=A0A1F4YGP1_9BACT|nr:MAG: nucleotide exchange factor GrpE [Candidatus Amesbacteria bacterium RIFCSPHIGHO2_01_FULL_48_32b]OGD07468.1 MAG: nucleotide exchange factor GrpE [Candidatus Amesbacteria bacterium RIFCSPLOWO2_01_FULL_49_25]
MKSKKTIADDNHQVLIKSLQDQISSLDENWKRALADYQNLVKRVEADKKDFVQFANMNLLAKLIPVLDILKLAAQHSQDSGIKMAVSQFRDVLSSENVQEILPAPGDSFNHQFHECLETLPGEPDNTIVEVTSAGYKIDKFIIRPARVKVYKKV